MQPFTNTTLPILTSVFGLVLMCCPGTETGAEMEDQCRVEHYVFSVVSPALNCPCPAWWATAAASASWEYMRTREPPLCQLYFLCHWQFFVEFELFVFSTFVFSFSAVEPLNKQWPLTACIKSKKKVADTCAGLKKQFKQFGYEFFCKAILFCFVFLLACIVRFSFISLSAVPFLLHNKHPSDTSQASCIRECWQINECADFFGT